MKRYTAELKILVLFLILFFGVLFLANTSSAAVYYVDYEKGNDNNNGLSKSTPWKLAPGMQGFSASYSHQPGDRFILNGGVAWFRVFTWEISNSGSSSNWDYYGVDKTWYSGSSWTTRMWGSWIFLLKLRAS